MIRAAAGFGLALLLAGAAAAQPAYVVAPAGEWRSSQVVGLAVYNPAGQKLGTISDLLLTPAGEVRTAVLGVGGFLGMGDRLVAVPYGRLRFAFKTAAGGFVGPDGQAVVFAAPPAPAPAAGDSVGAAVDNAGRAVGHAASVVGSAVTSTVSDALNGSGAGPDRALLDATEDELKAAPAFSYPSKN